MNSNVDDFKTYLFSYEHNGSSWGFDVQARSLEEAKARLSKMSYAKYDGVLTASICVPDARRNKFLRWLASMLGR